MAGTPVSEETARVIRVMDEEFVRNVNSGDAAALVAGFYADDAELLPPNHALVAGSPAILEFWKGMIGAGLKLGVLVANRVEESGDLAYASGVYELTLSPPGGAVSDAGKYVVVYRRRSDRTWSAIADIFNSNRPAA